LLWMPLVTSRHEDAYTQEVVAMSNMLSRIPRWMALNVVSCVLAAAMLLVPNRSAAQAPETELAAIEQLKTEAFTALRDGQFDRTHELLNRAAAISDDPGVTQMVLWIQQFEDQRQQFLSERRKQHEKALADAHLLLDHEKPNHAIAQVARAYLLADDKDAFRNDPWVDAIVTRTIRAAGDYETQEEWIKAIRLYSELGTIEPANPLWKDKLKLITRRVRLLSTYTPDMLKALREHDTKEAESVRKLLDPEAEAARARDELDNDDQDSFRIDWRESLRGVRADMLRQALQDAQANYYRDVNYRMLLVGGLNGLRAIATTSGLEQAFPELAEQVRRESFLAGIEDLLLAAQQAAADDVQMVYSTLRRLGNVNRDSLRLPEEVWVSEFADGAFAELDPFTSMIWPSDLEEFAKTTQGEFSGVGIQIQSDEDGGLRVVSPLEDTPAYRAGIKAGDIITHIDGRNAKGITLNQAVRTITGPVGTPVTLSIRNPDGNTRDYTIVRETIKVASVKGWRHMPGGGWDYLVDPDQKIGYVRLTNLTRNTPQDLDRAISDMKRSGARALILDLRYNPGGLLNAATDVADRFLREGLIVSTQADRGPANQQAQTHASRQRDEIDLPTVVLVNQYSASASEIVSGALKDHKRAIVVGERTFGKGSVQMLFPLRLGRGEQPSAYLKLTTSHYYLPSNRNIHRKESSLVWGVDPDVVIEMTPEQMRAAIDARQELDVLRDVTPPAASDDVPLHDLVQEVEAAVEEAVAARDPLQADPQLSAALLLLRLQLAGAQL
jgi:carboxyl-terminal processing protease